MTQSHTSNALLTFYRTRGYFMPTLCFAMVNCSQFFPYHLQRCTFRGFLKPIFQPSLHFEALLTLFKLKLLPHCKSMLISNKTTHKHHQPWPNPTPDTPIMIVLWLSTPLSWPLYHYSYCFYYPQLNSCLTYVFTCPPWVNPFHNTPTWSLLELSLTPFFHTPFHLSSL